MKNIIYIVMLFLFFACNNDEHIFNESPAKRMRTQVTALENELVNAPLGWKMLYFPRTDSLLFTSPNKVVNRMQSHFARRLENEGFGGFQFQLKFLKSGQVEMLADYTSESIDSVKVSGFEIKQTAQIQLSFTTYNYIHQLVNDKFRGTVDFLYMGRDTLQNLVFKTMNYIEPAREYIVLEKIEKEEEVQSNMKDAYANRKFFEEMKNPQLLIHRGSREFFRSDVYIKRNVHNINHRFLKAIVTNRFYVFEEDANPIEKLPKRQKSRFLGSGYVGTKEGLVFRAGLRYNKKIIFYNFVRKGDRFISKYYDPTGVNRGFIAEIWDEEPKD